MSDLALLVRIVGDASALKAEVGSAQQAIGGLSASAAQAGGASAALQTLSGHAATAQRAVLALSSTGVTGNLTPLVSTLGSVSSGLASAASHSTTLQLALAGAGGAAATVAAALALVGGAALALRSAYQATAERADDARRANDAYAEALRRSNEQLQIGIDRSHEAAEQRRQEAISSVELSLVLERETLARANNAAGRAAGVAERLREAQLQGRASPEQVQAGIARAGTASAGLATIGEQISARIAELDVRLAQLRLQRYPAPAGPPAPTGTGDRPPGRGGGGAGGRDEGVESTLRELRALQREGELLAQTLRTPYETLNADLERYGNLLRAGAISQETFNRAVTAAGVTYRRSLTLTDEMQRNQRAIEDLVRFGERGFENLGRSISDAIVQGKFDFQDLSRAGTAAASELSQIFIQLALLNPLKNRLTGGNATTLTDVFSMVGTSYRSSTGPFYGSGPSAGDASGGGFLFHGGGIVGAGAPFRAAPSTLWSTAPRYHAGLAPDEQAAILRRGEGVFTEEQMAAMGPAGGSYTFAPTINFTGDAGSAKDRDALLAGMRSLVAAELRVAVPGIVQAAKGSLRTDVRRQGATRALGGSF